MKKVVFIVISLNSYNAPFFNKFCDLYKHRYETTIIYSRTYQSEVPKDINKHIKLVPVEPINPLSNPLVKMFADNPQSFTKYFLYYKNLSKILDEIKPDIVHTILYFMPYSMQAARYCRSKHIPLILLEEVQREPYSSMLKLADKTILYFLKKYVVNYSSLVVASTKQGRDFQKKFFGGSEKKFVHIPWPVNSDRLLKLKRKETKTGCLRILVVARFVPYKEYDTILNSMQILKDKGIPFKLSIVGRGPLGKHIKSKIISLGLKNHVRIHEEFIERKKLEELYCSSDLLILASHYESYGMVVPEAMACGCAVIVSDTVGVRFMVKNNENGFIFRTRNARDLVDKILLAKRDLGRLKNNSRKILKAKYSEKVVLEYYGEILSRLI